VSPDILLNTLENYVGICGIALAWFKSYLSDHYQFVAVNECLVDVLSSYRSQGSVLRCYSLCTCYHWEISL